jgi:outer membrane receptor protein involved in Fe transport
MALAIGTAAVITASLPSAPAFAEEMLEEVVVTGTRIRVPGTVSSSPIFSVGSEEISMTQEVEVEKILRNLPVTIPGDGQNVNNGTGGAASINLRGLGTQRNLVMTNGLRMTPYNYNGIVDTQVIPTALIDRVDIITGGASAVYGSDAIAGALNFVMKDDFEGVDFRTQQSETGEGDGMVRNMSLTLGSNLDGGRGNVSMNITWQDREAVLLGQRPLGNIGIDTASGANLAEFLAGVSAPTTDNCSPGSGAVQSGGSTTSIPTRMQIVGATGTFGQYRDDRTLGSQCSVFNFNPFNYYQTPQEKYSGYVSANYEIDDAVNVYSRFQYSNVTVRQQVAPSGTFGQPFRVPVANFYMSQNAQAKQLILDTANAAVTAGDLVPGASAGSGVFEDPNGNGIVDDGDYLLMVMRRRTLELGTRSENYDSDHFQFVTGVEGDVFEDFHYNMVFQYGETNRTTVRGGYTNLTNIGNALDSVDGVTCANGDPTCVPIDLFGGFGTITPAMAGYAQAIALQQQTYDQLVFNASFGGVLQGAKLPTADNALAFDIGFETREENGALEPDECLKLAPASCQGGAGGNILPISGGYKVDEFFVEAIMPLIEGADFAQSLNLELGFRASDYSSTGSADTWKVGLNWRPIDSLLVRVMQQQANRAPNVGELFSPVTTGLDNAKLDPCSVANVANIDAALTALCISTGMTAGQVGTVQDVISGQVTLFSGSDPTNPPSPEEADTMTVGFVWTPELDFVQNTVITLDYYDIDIKDVIGNFSAQEILDGCYGAGLAEQCSKVNRIGGDLTISGAGINLFTTNLDYLQASGLELGVKFDIDLGGMGNLNIGANVHKYLTQESQSSITTPVIDCKGYFSTDCDPVSELRWTSRATWNWNKLTVSGSWRHIGSVDITPVQAASVFSQFRTIDAYDYIDLYAAYDVLENVSVNFGIDNAFDEDPPVLGNEAGDTSSNSGNTFPSNYDTLGRIFTVGVNVTF